ncbi:MAG TPA: hypothetical protein VFE23_21725 [Usitatibacter sp.]|jgi:hypothetical protein|nr:hypothetical protein [Usitatibacter sp.]
MKPAAKRSMEQWATTAGLQCTDGYCDEPLENVPWLNPETRQEFESADGNELGNLGNRPKIAALHSSSALAVNVFDYWRHRDKAALAGVLPAPASRGITGLRFEQKFPSGVGPRSPNLDMVLECRGDAILAIESKFTEWTEHAGHKPLRDAYLPAGDRLWARNGLSGAQEAAEEYMSAGFDHLDVQQLLKHMLGLAHTRAERPWTLLLLWHRCDEELAPSMEEEITRFKRLLGVDGSRFEAMTYQRLWKELVPLIRSEHAKYVEYITARYFAETESPQALVSQQAKLLEKI